MPYFELLNHATKNVIFCGQYPSFHDCLERAIKENISLSYIDLSHKNLTNISLDGAHMPNALFDGANLTGANMSEANLTQSSFKDCALFNCCFSYSNIEHSNFKGAYFGATLIEGANISGCIFSTLSCFDLEFMHVHNMSGCLFVMPDNSAHPMTKHPIVFKGVMNTPIIILDHVIKIGAKTFSKSLAPTLLNLLETCIQPIDSNHTHAPITLIPPIERSI